jgi:transposase
MDMDSHSAQVCRLEVVNTGRRRRWSFEEKLRIVEESFSGHRQASATARRHDISQSLLFRWRRSFRQGRLGMAPAEPDLVPAVIMPDDEHDDDDDEDGQAGVGRMEIVTKSGGRVIVGADVDAGALARVLKVLARR